MRDGVTVRVTTPAIITKEANRMVYNLRELCKAANFMAKQGMTRSEAFKAAWKLAKAAVIEKVAGVTFGNRQTAIAHLTRYDAQDINLHLRREQDNAADQNAVAVWAEVTGKGAYQLGYIPRVTASKLAPMLDKGINIKAALEAIVGGYDGLSWGLRIKMAV